MMVTISGPHGSSPYFSHVTLPPPDTLIYSDINDKVDGGTQAYVLQWSEKGVATSTILSFRVANTETELQTLEQIRDGLDTFIQQLRDEAVLEATLDHLAGE